MTSHQTLPSISETLKALQKCTEVRALVRFGTSETWCRISKIEARRLLASYAKSDLASTFEGFGPDGFGSYDGYYALYLGQPDSSR